MGLFMKFWPSVAEIWAFKWHKTIVICSFIANISIFILLTYLMNRPNRKISWSTLVWFTLPSGTRTIWGQNLRLCPFTRIYGSDNICVFHDFIQLSLQFLSMTPTWTARLTLILRLGFKAIWSSVSLCNSRKPGLHLFIPRSNSYKMIMCCQLISLLIYLKKKKEYFYLGIYIHFY